MISLPFLLYVGLCMVVALLGRNTRFGYWGCSVAAFVVTPLLMLVLLVILGRARPRV